MKQASCTRFCSSRPLGLNMSERCWRRFGKGLSLGLQVAICDTRASKNHKPCPSCTDKQRKQRKQNGKGPPQKQTILHRLSRLKPQDFSQYVHVRKQKTRPSYNFTGFCVRSCQCENSRHVCRGQRATGLSWSRYGPVVGPSSSRRK